MLATYQKDKLIRFSQALINQEKARVIVRPMRPASGHWFGGGNLIEDQHGVFYLSGRYRNFGDSRTGLGAGERGLELTVFASHDRGQTFEKQLSFSKADLSTEERQVLSIEGSALQATDDGVELFVSSEKALTYPDAIREFQKPTTGIWTIDRLRAATLEGLRNAKIETLLQCQDPRFLHVKDPFLYQHSNGDSYLGFCTHPFNWSSSNTGYTVRPKGSRSFRASTYVFFRRGFTWDVAISRVTCMLRVPNVGAFAAAPPLILAFYDGGEAMRNLDEHKKAIKRPRGYSCEEIGGLAVMLENDVAVSERLSVNFPLFVSPYGTGASRYVDVLQTQEGFYATWEQSQSDLSQPLVMNFLSYEEAVEILTE